MKTLIKLTLAIVMFAATFAAQAEWVSGYVRSNGTYVAPHYRSSSGSPGGYSGYSRSSSAYVYRNPYAATPSQRVSGYTRNDGVTVLPYYRTPANHTVTDNLSYRGYGTVRVLKNSYVW